MTKMNADVKAKWIDRLNELDGKDMQAHGGLKDPQGKMCCLGVLCEIAVEEGVISEPRLGGIGYVYDDADSAFLPVNVMHWAGLREINPTIDRVPLTKPTDEYRTASTLSFMNDRGENFGRIAAVINEQF